MHSCNEIDTNACPLCGKPNHCVMGSGCHDPATPCWCASESFPQSLLNNIPAPAKNRACICNSCLQTEQK